MKTKKLISLLMTAILLLGAFAISATAEATEAVGTGQQLHLGDDLTMRFYVDADADTVVNVTVDGIKTAYDLSGKTQVADGEGQGKYEVPVSLTAAQMTSTITLDFKQGGVDVQNSSSVREYALAILNGDYPDYTKTMVERMLNYGAAAQNYFGVNIGNLANAGHEISYEAQLPEGYEDVSISGQISGVRIVGATLVFKSKITLRYIFEADSMEGVTFTANGRTYTAVEKNGQFYVDIPGINPQEYADIVVLSAVKGEESLTVSYSPMHYIVRMSKKTNTTEPMKALLNAMYGYKEAAVAYVSGGSIFATGYDTALWDISGQYDGYVTVIGGGGATDKPLQFAGQFQNVDLTLNARDYADSTTASRTEFGFEFDVDGDGVIDTSKGDQTVTFGIAQADRVQTRGGTILSWKTPYDLSAAKKAQLIINEEEIAAGKEDGLDLRVIRYGTMIYLFVENKQVAVCDLTKCANSNGDTESGVTAETKMFIFLRHYDDVREAGVQIPFAISTEIAPVEFALTAGENGTIHAGYVNHYVNNGRTSKLSDTHFVGEKIVLT